MKARFGRLIMVHMIADTDAELHAMADRIGVARKWHQGDHYDIALSKRDLAIASGARPITWRQAGLMAMHRRRNGVLPSPEDAERLFRERMTARQAGA